MHSCGKGHSTHQLSRDLASSDEESGFMVELKIAKLVRVLGSLEMGCWIGLISGFKREFGVCQELAPTFFSIVRVQFTPDDVAAV